MSISFSMDIRELKGTLNSKAIIIEVYAGCTKITKNSVIISSTFIHQLHGNTCNMYPDININD